VLDHTKLLQRTARWLDDVLPQGRIVWLPAHRWERGERGRPRRLVALRHVHECDESAAVEQSTVVRTRSGGPEDTPQCPPLAAEDTDFELSRGENRESELTCTLSLGYGDLRL